MGMIENVHSMMVNAAPDVNSGVRGARCSCGVRGAAAYSSR